MTIYRVKHGQKTETFESIDWEEAMEIAKQRYGYSGHTGYIPRTDWNEIITEAKYIMREYQLDKREFFQDVYRDIHKEYLQTKEWKTKREAILKRDDYTCQKCGAKAECVHHNHYNSVGTDKEIHACISLCNACHKRIHFKTKQTTLGGQQQ